DRGKLRSYRGGYGDYLERRAAELEVEAEQAALFDKKLAQEEAWLRRGIKARRTRNEGRVRALQAMREERRARRTEQGAVAAQLQEAEKSGKIVLRARHVTFSYDAAADTRPVVADLSVTVQRGDRIGIVGPNGSGKTTLLRLLLGRLLPKVGEVVTGAKVEVAYFEQLHDTIDPTKTVFQNVGEGRDTVTVGGTERHVVGYLRDFLFSNEQIQGPVTKLSGGELKRLQLAKVLSRPCNLLVLDEPTNDLDLETLELVEDLLAGFDGTVLLVSHDREFLDNVVTSTLVFEGAGRWMEYAGGYEDWLRQRKADETESKRLATRSSAAAGGTKRSSGDESGSSAVSAKARKLGYQEKRELDALPDRIEKLEVEKNRLFTLLSSPDFYRTRTDEIATTKDRLATIEEEILAAYERWETLEKIRETAG
ncbi:MAG: ATP-binding cassette domain-containing protein, partial [Candidatus Eisenbacteria bacterium]|nr:ATP-binding cassette domain-containing protein [Candidatus Eisenbacteria bacterium]